MIENYIIEKCEVLEDFGITNSVLLEEHFKAKIKGLTDESKMEIRIDQISNDIIKRRLFGRDNTYVLTDANATSVYEALKAKLKGRKTADGDFIRSAVGKNGFYLLKKHNLIKSLAINDGDSYAI